MSMISAYNLYLGGYLPKVSPKTNVHNRRELKNRYKSIVTMNNAQPLSIVRLTGDTQAYALDVKEMSMELGEAAKEALSSDDGTEEKLGDMAELFDRLLSRSDQFAEACGNPSRPGASCGHWQSSTGTNWKKPVLRWMNRDIFLFRIRKIFRYRRRLCQNWRINVII